MVAVEVAHGAADLARLAADVEHGVPVGAGNGGQPVALVAVGGDEGRPARAGALPRARAVTS